LFCGKKYYYYRLKDEILLKSKDDIWKLKSEPGYNQRPYLEWRKSDQCCAIM